MSDFITNAELRIEAEHLCDENEQLQAENSKLRELVRDMGLTTQEYCEKYSIPHNWNSMITHIYQRKRELGVEVD